MSASPIAGIQARIASLEARFDRLGNVPAGAAGSGTVPFEPAMRAALGVASLGEMPETAAATPSAAPSGVVTGIGSTSRTLAMFAGTLPAGPAPDTVGSSPRLDGPIAGGTPFAEEFTAAGAANGVPPRLLAAVGWVESRYQVDAVSPAGAIGLMQIMPMTAAELGVDPTDPVAAIHGAARLLAAHHDRFGSWDLALAAYHSGAGAVSRAGDTAPPRSVEYVRRVSDRLEQT